MALEVLRWMVAVSTDEVVHRPWQLVTEYLTLVARDPELSRSLLSERWRTSPDFRKYAEAEKDLDVANYKRFGRRGRCIDVVRIESRDRVILSAGIDCFIKISGQYQDLLFTIVRSTSTHAWEIERIQMLNDRR